MAEIQNDTEFDYSMDKLDNESLVILDSDITDILFPSQQGGVNTSDKNASGEKRNALDDTVFNQQLPAKSKVKFDDVDSEEAGQILNDWEELRKDPIKEAMVGRLQDHYNQRLKSVTEDFEARMTQMETAMKKKTDEQRNFRTMMEEEEQTQQKAFEDMKLALVELQNTREKDAVTITRLRESLKEKTDGFDNLQRQLLEVDQNHTNRNKQTTDANDQVTIKASLSGVMEYEEPSSDSVAPANVPSTNKATMSSHVPGGAMIATIKPATISKFGIKMWTEENSLLDHMAQVSIGLEVAAQSGHNALSVQKSLIFQSLPARCQWTRSYLENETTVDGIIRRIVTLLEGGKELQLHAFMKIQRRRDEPLLEFFTKIRRIYGFSVNKPEKDLSSDSAAVSFMVQKMIEAMEEGLAQEFTKRIEGDLEDGNLTFSKISDAIIRITRLSMKNNISTGILAQVKSKRDEKCTKCNRHGHSEVDCWKDITCPKCQTKGHPGHRCRKFPPEGQTREVSTEGRKCFACKQKGHLRANCPERQSKEHSKWQNK